MTETTAAPTQLDRDAVHARYRAERDKRLRPDGNDQYLQPTGKFAHLLDDPWTERRDRPPVAEELDVVVIGAGFGGLATAARLVQAGVTDLRLVDAAGGVGGTWYWNRYPGAMCDTAA
ncbi:MAG: NAD(P)-binding protein, partial [Microthrixaceae bacterium]